MVPLLAYYFKLGMKIHNETTWLAFSTVNLLIQLETSLDS